MSDGTHVIALSGGKDSTAMALALRDSQLREYVYLCTPTGNELPELEQHWQKLEQLLGAPMHRVTNRTLEAWIESYEALPNWRQRWCTRILKVEACQAFMLKLPQPVHLYVGLRADEEAREGVIYGGAVIEHYPLRDWGWKLDDVVGYLKSRGVSVPPRTDCAWCFYQRIEDWWRLWKEHPGIYERGVQVEEKYGYTFRSPGRDTWPAPLRELRAEFERGRVPRSVKFQLAMFEEDAAPCRVCSL